MTALKFLPGQLRFLREEGYALHLACARNSDLEQFAKAEGVRLHDVPLARTWWARSDFLSLLRAIRVLQSLRPDVVNYSTPKAAMVWAIASWFYRPNLVVYLLRGLRLEGQRAGTYGFTFLWLAELLAARSAHITVCVSHSLRMKALTLRLIRRSKSVVFGRGSSNGVDAARFKPATPETREDARKTHNLGRERFVVGYIGRMNRDKGVPELLDAVEAASAAAPEVECLLVGSIEPGFDLDDELRGRPEARVRTHWFPATGCVEKAYAALDAFVLPSHREGMSNALLEAQAMAIPCITTTATGCGDAVLPGSSALIVPVGDARLLADAIIRLSRDPRSRFRMGAAGRAHVVEHFRPEDRWQDYASLYRSRSPAPSDATNTAQGVKP